MTDVGDDCQAHRFGIQCLGSRRAPNPPAVFETGVLGDLLFSSGWAIGEEQAYLPGEFRADTCQVFPEAW